MDTDVLVSKLTAFAIPDDAIAFRPQDRVIALGEQLDAVTSTPIGKSRRGQPLVGWQFGNGDIPVSIVAGSHADEPVGPMTAQALPDLLAKSFAGVLESHRFTVVPQINPDGADYNRAWFGSPPDFTTYVKSVVREQPGDDIEFGFGDTPRPEVEGAMGFLREHGPYAAHFSLHGMGFGEGAWFLICREWIERSGPLMDTLRAVCAGVGLGLHDVDRQGEKGFERIGEGFCTTPLATAMRRHFIRMEQSELADKFQPTSMEFVQSLGGDPFCGVTEMPLFLVDMPRTDLVNTPTQRLRKELETAAKFGESLEDIAARYRIAPLSIETQMRMQVAFILSALATIAA